MKKQINCQYDDCLEIILNYLRNKTHIRPILIGIDGRSGSGKTTLVNNIKKLNHEISIITGDDFYQHLPLNIHGDSSFNYKYHSYFDRNMFKENILLPVKNLKEINYKKYDWIKKTFSEEKTFTPTNIVFFEGVFMCSPDLVKYFDLSIFLDSKRDLCYDRLVKRDSSQEWITEWQDTEDWYFEHHPIKKLVDILIHVK